MKNYITLLLCSCFLSVFGYGEGVGNEAVEELKEGVDFRFLPVKEVDGEMPGSRYEAENLHGKVPLVFRGAGLGWEAMGWTRDWWRTEYVDISMPLFKSSNLDEEQRRLSNEEIGRLGMGDFIEGIETGGLVGVRTLKRIRMNHEVETSWLFGDQVRPPHELMILNINPYRSDYSLIVGGSDQVTGLHAHESVEVLMIEGEKVFYLVSPAGMRVLCEESGGRDNVCDGLFAQRGELGVEVEVYEVVLKPGDVLYIPWYWGHEVYPVNGHDLTVSIVL